MPISRDFNTPAQRATSLIARVDDAELRVRLRDAFEERAAICEYEGGVARDKAERIALEEIQAMVRARTAAKSGVKGG